MRWDWDHDNEQYIICPYCKYEDQDCYELMPSRGSEGDGKTECISCGKAFEFYWVIDTTWSTRKIEQAQEAGDEPST